MSRTYRFFVVCRKASRSQDSGVNSALSWNGPFRHRTCTIFHSLSRSLYSVRLFPFRFHNAPHFHKARTCRWILEVRILLEWLLSFLVCGKCCPCSRIVLTGAEVNIKVRLGCLELRLWIICAGLSLSCSSAFSIWVRLTLLGPRLTLEGLSVGFFWRFIVLRPLGSFGFLKWSSLLRKARFSSRLKSANCWSLSWRLCFHTGFRYQRTRSLNSQFMHRFFCLNDRCSFCRTNIRIWCRLLFSGTEL